MTIHSKGIEHIAARDGSSRLFTHWPNNYAMEGRVLRLSRELKKQNYEVEDCFGLLGAAWDIDGKLMITLLLDSHI